MAVSKNINSFRDVHQLFLLAMEHGSIEIAYGSYKEAFREVARLNGYRRLLREENRLAGVGAACEFDDIVVRHCKSVEGKPTEKVQLEFRKSLAKSITAMDTGAELSIPEVAPAVQQAVSSEEEDFLNQVLAERAAGGKPKLLE